MFGAGGRVGRSGLDVRRCPLGDAGVVAECLAGGVAVLAMFGERLGDDDVEVAGQVAAAVLGLGMAPLRWPCMTVDAAVP